MVIVNGEKIEWEKNMTISRVLEKCKYSYPNIMVKVNGTLVKREHYSKHIVKDRDVVQVIHLMSGG